MEKRLTLDVYSHGIRISGYTRETFAKLSHFLEGLKLKEPRKLPPNQGGYMVMELKKRFYGLREDNREAFIHRHQLNDLLMYFRDLGIPEEAFAINHIPIPSPVPATLTLPDGFVPRDYQITIVPALADNTPSRRLYLQTGRGKASHIDALIKIPGGWKRMGDIQVGDTITAWDGTPNSVTGVYPQGKKPVYRVTFADGRSTVVCGEHLWQSYYVNTSKERRWKVRDTHELMRLINMPNPRVYIPLIDAEDGPDMDLPIPPYTLGAILGDGYVGESTIQISKPDAELFDSIREELLPGHKLSELNTQDRCPGWSIIRERGNPRNNYIDGLNELDLTGRRSWEKFIPETYLHGSRAQRLALLQGLMDTDGTVNTQENGGSVTFNSTSYRLATGVQYLVRSLGGLASIKARNTKYPYKGEKRNGRTSYNVNIRYPKPSELFRLPRKYARTNDDNQYATELKLRVMSIEPIGCKEAQCISIDHPDRLYVTDDFIVTHNTACSLMAAAQRGHRLVIMIPPKYFGLWLKALKETYLEIEERMVTVSGSAELQALQQRAVEGELTHDVYIISSVTYRTYLDSYEKFGERMEEIGYLIPPPRFHEALGIGTQISDEIHEDPGLVYRTDIFTNVAKQIYLSATPYTGNDYVTRMINVMLPAETDCPLPAYDAYINVVALLYNDGPLQRTDYLAPFKGTYNHARYETRLLKSKRRLERYYKMVKKVVDRLFVSDQQPGQKMLILCATVEFIKHLTKFLNMSFPNKRIGMHVAGSDYNKLLTNDITVSTIKSAGTGVDIPDLREVLLLQATDSKKDNIQILGRPRRLKSYPDVNPRLTYLVCQDIQKHVAYHRNKKNHFDGRVLSHRVFRL